MGGIFVVYRDGDARLGDLLVLRLTDRFGAGTVVGDCRAAERATVFEPDLWSRLRRSDVLLVVIGPHWLTEEAAGRLIDRRDDFVRAGIAEALREGVDVVPVLLGDTPPPVAAELPPDIRGLAGRPHRAVGPQDVERFVVELAVRQDGWDEPEQEPADDTGGGYTIDKITAARDVIVGDQTNNVGGGR